METLNKIKYKRNFLYCIKCAKQVDYIYYDKDYQFMVYNPDFQRLAKNNLPFKYCYYRIDKENNLIIDCSYLYTIYDDEIEIFADSDSKILCKFPNEGIKNISMRSKKFICFEKLSADQIKQGERVLLLNKRLFDNNSYYLTLVEKIRHGQFLIIKGACSSGGGVMDSEIAKGEIFYRI